MTTWHQLKPDDVLAQLDSNSAEGLSSAEATRRLEQHGPNELVESGGRGPWQILWEQISSAMVVLLIAAAVVSWFLGEHTDAIAIFAIIALNAALGFFQDYRAEKALAALKQLSVPRVKVRRDGSLEELSARELVPGDVILLEVGNLVPADARLLESSNIKIEEASLTGESEPVEKQTEPRKREDLPLGDRDNMAFMGTLITYGHGVAVVTETGMSTQLGQIATSLQTVRSEPTPLQSRLAQLGRTLAIVSIVIVAIVFGLGILADEDPRLMLMTSLSLAVAIVPEGLPAVATVALAIGARRMFRRNVLIRKLPAVETLGSVTVICSDKTGTLTENRMTVVVLDVRGHRLDLTESLRRDMHQALEQGAALPEQVEQLTSHPSMTLLMAGAALCNDAELVRPSGGRKLHALGEPTEEALVVAAARLGLVKPDLEQAFPRVSEVPFDSERKRMTTVHRLQSRGDDADRSSGVANAAAPDGDAPDSSNSAGTTRETLLRDLLDADRDVAFMKGAVDVVLETCVSYWSEEGPQPLTDDVRASIMETNDQLAANGMRVLGVAVRQLDQLPETSGDAAGDAIEQQMIFVGVLGMIDPPRPEVREAVSRCSTAGIRPMMITGDHPLTAQHIAAQLGIGGGSEAVAGATLARMSVSELEPVTEQTSVYARVAPRDKLHIVQALQNRGEIVAMTGDGVNDAPALKQAHIGVAMGQTGTDVSKEAADMVLLDDNFATIVNAVEEGRIVYDNIRKFVRYTMTSNAGEIWVMVLGPLVGMPLPLLPLQILWVNLVTDGLPGIALALEPAERETMRRPPHPPGEHIMGRGMWRDIAWVGLLMGVVSLALGYWRWTDDAANVHWRTIVFTVLTLSQMGNALAIRSDSDSLFRIGLFSNKALLGSVLLTFLLQLGVIYMPALQAVFKTTSLSFQELSVCLLLSTVIFWAAELKKWVWRARSR